MRPQNTRLIAGCKDTPYSANRRHARTLTVTARLDTLFKSRGGRAALGRKVQLSHRFLAEELRLLETMAVVFPSIFLGIAVFLLNVVMSRLIGTQREQVAILKAFGCSNLDVGLHYTESGTMHDASQ